MSELALATPRLPAMTDFELGEVWRLQHIGAQAPQIPLRTQHVLHAGLYSRTIWVPAGAMIVGALIKIPTLVLVEGNAVVWLGDRSQRLTGHSVLPASAGRKQVFVAFSDTRITMIFPTSVRTVEEAERQFTDEADDLCSRRDADNEIIITGE